MNRKENISWLFTGLVITFAIAIGACSILKSILYIAKINLSFDISTRCVLSISLISLFVIGIRCVLNYEKPIGSRRAANIRRIIGWILVILSIIGIVLSIISLIGNYKMVQSVIAQYGDQYNDYGKNDAYNWLFLHFAGRDIIFSGLIFAWGFYLIKCGPMYSPIWKRIVKVVLYIIATYVLLDNTLTYPSTSWYGIIIVFLVMSVLVAITTNYVKEPESHITEDVQL